MSDITNVGGSSDLPPSYYTQDSDIQNPPQTTTAQTTTESSLLTTLGGTTTAQTMSEIPSLPSPLNSSMDAFFKILSDAKVELNQQFRASDFVDQVTRRKESRAAGLAAQALAALFASREEALNTIASKVIDKTDQLQQQTTFMKTMVDTQNANIRDINAQNSQDQSMFLAFTTQYYTYIGKLNENGITGTTSGTTTIYTIPAGKEAIFNSLTATYNNAVTTINDYWKTRATNINNYNVQTLFYNSTVDPDNSWLTNFIKDNNLGGYLTRYGISVPVQEKASLISEDGITYTDDAINPSQEIPVLPIGSLAIVSSPSAFSMLEAAGHYNRSASEVPSIPVFNSQDVALAIASVIYDISMLPLYAILLRQVQYYGFLRILTIFSPNQDYTPDPILNFKPLSRKIIPESIVQAEQPINTNNTQGVSALAIQSIGLDNPHITGILGKAAFAQAIRNLGLDLTEEQIDELANQTLILSMNLIGQNSLDALLPSLGPLASDLSSLPPDSPALGLVFSISFANRILESTGQALTADAIQALINGSDIAALQKLSPADLEALTAALNLGLLLVATQLLESSLGLPGLFAQLLLPLLPSNLAASILEETLTSNQQNDADLQAQIQASFLAKGFSQEEATFLGDVGTSLAKQNLLTPSSPSISQDTLNRQLLIDSIKASLILSDAQSFDLARADTIAREAVSRTLEDLGGQSISAAQFRDELQDHLRDLDVRSIVREEVLRDSLLVSNQNQSLQPEVVTESDNAIPPPTTTTTQPVQTNQAPKVERSDRVDTRSRVDTQTTEQTTQTDGSQEVPDSVPTQPPTPSLHPFTPLTQAQIAAVLEQQVVELLAPHLGFKLAKQITEEIAQTLFGTPNPDPRDKAQLKSPLSLVNTIANQVARLKVDQNEKYAEATNEAFKETIAPSVKLSVFLLDLMNPAYALVYSAGTSLMYAGHEPTSWKKSIDIIV